MITPTATHKYLRIIATAITCQLVIYGIQWPIMMAWGYPLHPASLLGNFLFTPITLYLIAALSWVFICFILHIPCASVLHALDYCISWWLYILQLPLYDVHYAFACPHWSILILIPIITYAIAWCAHTPWHAIMYLLIFFTITTVGLGNWYIQPHRISMEPYINLYGTHDTVIAIEPSHKHNIRYTDNWTRYRLLPTLRKEYGQETIDYIVTPRRKRSSLVHALHKANMFHGQQITAQQIIGCTPRLRSCNN